MSAASLHAAVRALALGAALGVLAALGGCQTPGSPEASGALPPSGQAVLPDSAEESEERRRARIRLELGASYYQQGKYAVALEELRQALLIDSSYALAYGVLGLVYMDMGERARAEESFQRGLRIAPADSDLNNNYGWFLCQGGRHRESLEYFQRALRNPLYPTPAKPLHNAGLCAQRMGDEKAAEAYFLRAFQVQPSDPVAMFNLGLINLKRRDVDRARFYAQRLLGSFEPTAEVLWLALRVERLAGNADALASLSSQLRRRFPESREAQMLASGNFSD
ncbi:MAG: type IV pilus biogenesis/stability protein PilW [Burkholderiaceae bacterium]